MDEITGFGVGTAVGAGTVIGLSIVTPDAPLMSYVATFGFYGFMTGMLYEMYRFAFSFRRPFGR